MSHFLKSLKVGWKVVSLLFFTLIAFSYAMFQGGFVSWFLFYSFLPFAIYSLLLMIYPIRSFRVTRRINQDQFSVGQRLVGTITIKRSFPFPLFYLLVEDELTEKLMGVKRMEEPKKLFFPWFNKTMSFSYALLEMPRGEHHFRSIRLRTGDLFGLIEKEVTVEVENYFLVYPSTVDLVYHSNQKQYEQGAASTLTKYWQDSTMAVGVREYQPGDKFAWIDWKATARRDSIMTKEFEQMQSHDVVIFFDRTPSPLFETAVSYAASLIQAITKGGARVGFVSVGEQSQVFPMQLDEQHRRNLFYHLAKVDCDSKTSFATILEENRLNTEVKQSTSIVVTSNLTLDLTRKLELLSGKQRMFILYLVKEKNENLSKEESVLVERMAQRQIQLHIVKDQNYKEVSNS
ncbi:DUF58 domain-containing protein [Metabacillus halosaccharovorans]|uniref:DUF58 domain-containing protein n=2 Tax=Metabacillus halosaccharovorans TaxID=930124 RepID=UPI001C1FE063|nr:DUF58 domain-containing protein [Metabacillus halosaccharovorans]MBU7595942.1 DUF58 domain-containing protein [Metabacillus halosaccharovorans]